MAFDEQLAERVREIISRTNQHVEEKKMFSGLCFMVNDKMCVGIQKDQLMVRLDPALFETVIEKDGCIPMEMTGRVMKGFVFVDKDVLTTKSKLEYWLRLALEYNPFAKASKK